MQFLGTDSKNILDYKERSPDSFPRERQLKGLVRPSGRAALIIPIPPKEKAGLLLQSMGVTVPGGQGSSPSSPACKVLLLIFLAPSLLLQ